MLDLNKHTWLPISYFMIRAGLLAIATIWLLSYLFLPNLCCPLEEVTTPLWVTGDSNRTRTNKETPPIVWARLLDLTFYTWLAASTYRLIGFSQECHPSALYIALLFWRQVTPHQGLVVIDEKGYSSRIVELESAPCI